MKRRNWGVILLTILNSLTTILSTLFILLIHLLAIPFNSDPMPDEVITNLKIYTTVTITIDVLKWLSYYFIVFKKYKLWLTFYYIYCLMFIYFVTAGASPIILIIPMLYLPIIIWLPTVITKISNN